MIKLSTGEYPRQTYDPEEVMKATLRAFQGITGVGDKPEGAAFDTGLAAEVAYALAAMMIEALPGVATNRDLRVMSEEAGTQILHYMRAFRDHHAETGRHPLERFGAVGIPAGAAN
ncbi:hypothetical protein GG804_14270 [Sphingomonas histidinilytica]|uniref:hypothetical protein n=1 Tax=Rhizorhabdus histidinilytica TaxID=439228 RepID=UPI001ADCB95E|nr:hypothetical protein [Rhizorhabdus histidinilytica]MBO9377936.1 hypothetical protein [Rhizorhabdus histidinilytica]